MITEIEISMVCRISGFTDPAMAEEYIADVLAQLDNNNLVVLQETVITEVVDEVD